MTQLAVGSEDRRHFFGIAARGGGPVSAYRGIADTRRIVRGGRGGPPREPGGQTAPTWLGENSQPQLKSGSPPTRKQPCGEQHAANSQHDRNTGSEDRSRGANEIADTALPTLRVSAVRAGICFRSHDT